VPDSRAIHGRFPIIDGHADTIGRYLDDPPSFFTRGREGHLDAERLREAGQNVQVMAAYTPPEHTGIHALRYALNFVWAFHALLDSPGNAALPSPFRPILSAADMRAACEPGKCGFLLFLEGATPLCGSLRTLDIFRRLGVRGVTITHNHDNEAARGCLTPGPGNGLTPFGRELVPALEERGMIVDVAHANESTFWDVLSLAKRPVVDSHTGLRRFWDHPRNLDDEQLEAVKRNGGMVCIDFVPDHILARADPAAPVRIADVVRVIEHAVERAGVDHVGLGADWDGFSGAIEGLEDVTGLPRLTDALLAAGFREEDAGKIIGGNLLRVLCEVLG
jgi:membrane dipeptidase